MSTPPPRRLNKGLSMNGAMIRWRNRLTVILAILAEVDGEWRGRGRRTRIIGDRIIRDGVRHTSPAEVLIGITHAGLRFDRAHRENPKALLDISRASS
jgi:hypothetical protein